MKKKTGIIIKTSSGEFKVRKNGRMYITLEQGTKREEILRVTPTPKSP